MLASGRIYIIRARYYWTLKFRSLKSVLKEMEGIYAH